MQPPSLTPGHYYSYDGVSTHPTFRVIVARTPAQVTALQPDIEKLLERTSQPDDVTGTPDYYLSVLREKKARPFVVAVYDRECLAGVFFAMKRCIWGISVGIVECGDLCGDGSLFLFAKHSPKTVEAALNTILRERLTWIARLSWNSETYSELKHAQEFYSSGNSTSRIVCLDKWSYLPLDNTYELFLNGLGRQTRRNMRYYRRRAEQQEWIFEGDIAPARADEAISSLYPLQEVGHKTSSELKSIQRKLADVPGTFFSGLRTKDGEWISIVGGWAKGTRLFILIQLNHAGYKKASVSMVLRSYLIETAIESGIRHLKFLGGCEGALRKYCRHLSDHLLVHRTNKLSRFSVWALARFFPSSSIGHVINPPQ